MGAVPPLAVPLVKVAPSLPGRILFDQRWDDLAFLHWAVDPAAVTPYLPPGTRPDVWEDGATYVGLVPFRMRRAGFGRGVPVPYFGSFLETNIRLYSIDADGRRGVVFRSLDADRLAVVLLARFGVRIPYLWARMRAHAVADVHTYLAERRWPGPRAVSELVLTLGERVAPTPLEDFLTMRWGMHSRRGRGTMWTPNRHDPWEFRSATIVHLHDEFGATAGFPLTGEPDLRPLWSPGVRAFFGRPRRVV